MNILIIEDELPAAKKLEKLLLEVDPGISLLGIKESVDSAIEWLSNHPPPDLLLVDIHLADGSSFDIFKELKVNTPVIFTTAYDQYALDAFKLNSIDYLLKPVKRSDLESAILKFKNLQFQYSPTPLNILLEENSKKYKDNFVIKIGTKIKTIHIDHIALFYSKGKLSFILDKEGRNYPLNLSLDKLQSIIDPVQFFRVNRQIITNRDSIKEIHLLNKSKIKLDLEPSTPLETTISTERTALFKKWLKKELS